MSKPLDMNAALDELWTKAGGVDALIDRMATNPDLFDKVMVEIAKIRARREVSGEGGGPLLIQLKQL